MIRRFLQIFGDSALPSFDWEKVDTYFAAAFSAAAGLDMREKLAYWGFEIDNAYYETVLPLVEARLPGGERASVRYVRPSGRTRPVSTKIRNRPEQTE